MPRRYTRPLPPLPSLGIDYEAASPIAGPTPEPAHSPTESAIAGSRSPSFPTVGTRSIDIHPQRIASLVSRSGAAQDGLTEVGTLIEIEHANHIEQDEQIARSDSPNYHRSLITLSTGQQVVDLSSLIYDFEIGGNMSTNNGGQNNHFPNFEGSAGNGNNRSGASPTSSHAGPANGNGINGAVNYMAPLPVGHQQDINFLYAQIQELTALLKANREKVAVITKQAEEVARRANGHAGDGEGDGASDAARLHELELELAKAHRIIEIYKEEQVENTALIGQYEDALGTATDQIREYCVGINDRFLAQKRHYNNLLQQEKDEHVETRLDRDVWMAKTMRVCEMIRTASRLRNEEWGGEVEVIAGLQYQVRMYRNALGMEKEKKEEETGWPWLKDVPAGPDGLSEYDG